MNRYLIIGAGAIVIIGIILAGYFFIFRTSSNVAVTTGTTGSTLPSAGQSGGTATLGSGTAIATGTPIQSPTPVSSRLVKISAGPVVPGEVVTDVAAQNASSSADTVVHYIERGSGNVYAYSGASGQITRTSNRTVPGIENAYWLPNGSLAFVQYLSGTDFSTVNTYGLPADSSSTTTTGFFLPQDLAGLDVSATGLLELASGVNGSSVTLSHTDGTHGTGAFSTPLSSLRAFFAGKSYVAFTKPSSGLPGYAYLVSATGAFTRIAGPLNGLVALPSPKGTWILVSYSSSGVLHSQLVNTATLATTELPVATIADKCTWASDESAVYCGIPQTPPATYAYPDDWYQGAISFSDRLWRINVAGRYAELVLDFSKETNATLDAEALSVDPNGKTLVFVNKNDGSLWSYSL